MKISSSEERLNELFSADPRSDSAIAAELDVSKQALSAWRKGIRSPKKTVLLKIAQIYNVSIDWLMGFDVPKIDEEQIGYQPETTEAKILANGIDIHTVMGWCGHASERMILEIYDHVSEEREQAAISLMEA